MIIISSKGKIGREEKILIMNGNTIVGEIPRSAVMGQIVTIKDGSTATTKVYDGTQWQQM